MENFEQAKKEYFNKLPKYIEFIAKLATKEENKKMIEILLLPKDEKELNFANQYIMFIEDTQKLIDGIFENHQEIKLSNSIFIEYIVNYINALTASNSIEEIKQLIKKYTDNDYKLMAQVVYEMFVIMNTNAEGVIKIICDKCGIDLNNQKQMKQLVFLLQQMQGMLPTELNSALKDNFDAFKHFTNYYHDLCINGIKDHSNLDTEEVLADLCKEETDNKTFVK